ncbi:YbgA family protein [Vagococcus sp. BWB3-3]|uniref:YbgA family protein n=1 Tax=Vagococcus allomyrinae TaxID=2794353 RepID=A0A940PC66_9ENTE|nr:YbgA family protein [Vagococcus allomyrinae]MBP1042100.1 YbgA family protein [Vagococcus allomyrinae]
MAKLSPPQEEWATWKYLVMSRSQGLYNDIRQLFSGNQWTVEKEKHFRKLLITAQETEPSLGSLRNAYQHVWGYFKKIATPEEKANFQTKLAALSLTNDQVKPLLYSLARRYKLPYLLNSRLLIEKASRTD